MNASCKDYKNLTQQETKTTKAAQINCIPPSRDCRTFRQIPFTKKLQLNISVRETIGVLRCCESRQAYRLIAIEKRINKYNTTRWKEDRKHDATDEMKTKRQILYETSRKQGKAKQEETEMTRSPSMKCVELDCWNQDHRASPFAHSSVSSFLD